jgi:hypothetical protein
MVAVEKNEQQLLFKHFGVLVVIVVLMFVYENVNGLPVYLP